jgi:uncharacterized membrane protein YeaQ/YmgE (transglycosylase-associated protein family)
MGLLEFLLLLLIAGICGAVAEMIVGFSPGGFLVSIIIGLLGAYVGSWLAGVLGLPPVLAVSAPAAGGFAFDIVWSILGAILLLLIVSLVRGVGRGRRRVAL